MPRDPVLVSLPSLDALAERPDKLASLSLRALVDLRRRVCHLDVDLKAAITCRMTADQQTATIEDRVLDVPEAARRLNVSNDYVYRHASEWPFTVRRGRKLGFSARGLADHLRRQQQGRSLQAV
jgi:hypothetical protein